MIAMMYYLFPADPHTAPFARSYSPAELADARASGIPVYVLPEVTARLRLSDGPASVDGLLPLTGPAELSR
jgi:hypothetical protein